MLLGYVKKNTIRGERMDSNTTTVIIDGVHKTLQIGSGNPVIDVIILAVVGLVIIGVVFTYGYFFGTRKYQEEVVRLKEENERLRSLVKF